MTDPPDAIVSRYLEAPDDAYAKAVRDQDIVTLAVAGILDPDIEGPRAARRFDALVEARGPDEVIAELTLGILERADGISDELIDRAKECAREHAEDLPVNKINAGRIRALVADQGQPDVRRLPLLIWLWLSGRQEARQIAQEILADPAESYSGAVRQSIIILGTAKDAKALGLLRDYAERQFVPTQTDAPPPKPHPPAALYVLNSLRQIGDGEMALILDVLRLAADRGIGTDEELDGLLERLRERRLRQIVESLADSDHSAWLSESLLPALLRVRGRDLAPTVGHDWWPDECLPVFARFAWDGIDDKLYVKVLKGLHRQKNEPARAAIRSAVRARCEATSPDGAGRMPRIGARALLELALEGSIQTSDEDLGAAMRTLGSEALTEEAQRVGWKKPDRSRRMAAALGASDPDVIPRVFPTALAGGPSTAVAFLEGSPQEVLDQQADELLAALDEEETVLRQLCSLSETAADLTLERWAKDQVMGAFRALADSARAEDRLEHVSKAVRSYREVGAGDRAELLRALDVTEDRLAVLLAVLTDRRNPLRSAPTQEDLVTAIGLLPEHLKEGGDPQPILEALQAICREATEAAVRRAAYAALAQGPPTTQLLDLLLERRDGEVPVLRSSVREALSRLADKLEVQAGASASADRTTAVTQLARIDPSRAVVHARGLLQAPEAKERGLAAETLGGTGDTEDADLLEAALEHEPNPEARREIQRAIRRLRIGDVAAAHERLGDLAGVEDPAWGSADPKNVFEQWSDPLVTGLDRIARAETNEDWGTAIDQLNEVGKALLFRVIELAGATISVKQADVVAAASNSLDYGSVVTRQHIQENWRWVRHLASLNELRTEHIARKGKVEAPVERTPEDWEVAQRLFRLGAGECCKLILAAVGTVQAPV